MKYSFLANGLAVLSLLMPASALADTFSVPGTGDGIEVLQAIAKVYGQEQGSATIEIPPSIGSGGGIAAVADGRAVLGRIARPLTEAEAGAGLRAVLVMRIPAVFYVHPSAGLKGLTYAQLAAIFAGTITNWQDAGGADMRIRVVRRENEDSTLKVLRATLPGWQSLILTTHSKVAVTTQDAVQTVKETEGAISFGPSGSALSNGLTVLQIEGLNPMDPDYPSVVGVSLIFKDGALAPQAEEFVKFARSASAAAVIKTLGALPSNN